MSLRIYHSTLIFCENMEVDEVQIELLTTLYTQFPQAAPAPRNLPSSLAEASLWSDTPFMVCTPQRRPFVSQQPRQRPQQRVFQRQGNWSGFSLLKCKNSVEIGRQPSSHKSNI